MGLILQGGGLLGSIRISYQILKSISIITDVGPKGSRGFDPFHFKPKAHTEEEEVPEDE